MYQIHGFHSRFLDIFNLFKGILEFLFELKDRFLLLVWLDFWDIHVYSCCFWDLLNSYKAYFVKRCIKFLCFIAVFLDIINLFKGILEFLFGLSLPGAGESLLTARIYSSIIKKNAKHRVLFNMWCDNC